MGQVVAGEEEVKGDQFPDELVLDAVPEVESRFQGLVVIVA